jgi:hypothetical protein
MSALGCKCSTGGSRCTSACLHDILQSGRWATGQKWARVSREVPLISWRAKGGVLSALSLSRGGRPS